MNRAGLCVPGVIIHSYIPTYVLYLSYLVCNPLGSKAKKHKLQAHHKRAVSAKHMDVLETVLKFCIVYHHSSHLVYYLTI